MSSVSKIRANLSLAKEAGPRSWAKEIDTIAESLVQYEEASDAAHLVSARMDLEALLANLSPKGKSSRYAYSWLLRAYVALVEYRDSLRVSA